MDSSDVPSKTFNCKIHPNEEIQRICLENETDTPLRCIECILNSEVAYGKGAILPLKDFIKTAAKFYETISNEAKLLDTAPNEWVEFLANEDDCLSKLTLHIEEEKTRINDGINLLLQEFTMLCHNKKELIFKNLDLQLINLKSNFTYYKSKLDKYFGQEGQENNMTKEDIIYKMDQCNTIDDFEVVVKNIKDDMAEASLTGDADQKLKEIKEGMTELCCMLKQQADVMPKTSIGTQAEIQKVVADFRTIGEDYLNKISEIEPIIDEMSLSNAISLDSKILTKPEHKKMVRDFVKKNGMVRFKLLYRGSRDGFQAATFHKKCDKIKDTLTVVRSNYKKIFGGFNPLTWDSTNNYKQTQDSWLFSVDNKDKYTVKPSSKMYAIYGYSTYGPSFGGGHDLYISDNCNTNNGCYSNFNHTYDAKDQSGNNQSALAGAYNFTVEEIEVFHVDCKGGVDQKFDSKLVKADEIKTLKNWIASGKSVDLDLIYRATRDGFDSTNFHEKCDNQGQTLVVCRSAVYNKVFGGFTSKSWGEQEDFVADSKAFLFSLTNKKKFNPMAADFAIFCAVESGPIFGAGYDLFICPNSNILEESSSALGLTYEASSISDPTSYLAGNSKFLLDEIEVFKVNIF